MKKNKEKEGRAGTRKEDGEKFRDVSVLGER